MPTQQRKSRLPLVLGGVACLLLGVAVAVGVVRLNGADPSAEAGGSQAGEALPAATQSSTGSPAPTAPSAAPSQASPAPSATVSAPAAEEPTAASAKPADTGTKTRLPQPTAKPTSEPASGAGTDLSGFGDRK